MLTQCIPHPILELVSCLRLKDPNEKLKEFLASNPLLSDFDAQIKYYQVGVIKS